MTKTTHSFNSPSHKMVSPMPECRKSSVDNALFFQCQIMAIYKVQINIK